MNHLCLNLICKDEEAVIERCLRSCLPIVDSWCIVDTGSTDRTMEIIRDIMKDLPGELHERPWVNFGHNKTEAMRLARDVAEYALLMDSDDMLVYRSTFRGMPKLDADSYPLLIQYGTDLEYDRPHIIRTAIDFEYVEPVHEYLDDTKHKRGLRIPGITYRVVGGGARSADPVAKFVRDAELLKKDLETRPDHARSVFYLAQSYRDAGVEEFGAADKLEGDAADAARARARAYYDLSLETYEKRAAMGDAVEEAFVAKLEAAMKREHIQALDGEEPRRARPDVVWGYMAAWEMRPQRAEPLYELARYLRTYGDHFQLAYQVASIAAKIPRPNDWLFVNNSVYRWRALDELAISAYYVGQRTVCRKACQQILATPSLPEDQRPRVKENLRLSMERK